MSALRVALNLVDDSSYVLSIKLMMSQAFTRKEVVSCVLLDGMAFNGLSIKG